MRQPVFNLFVVELTDKLFRFARSMLNDEALSKDVVQDTFLKLWQTRKDFGQVKNKEAYAYVILKNKCLDLLKAHSNRLKHDELKDNHVAQSANYDKKEEIQLVRSLINKLPASQQMIIQLREIEGKSFADIAEIMDIEEGNVRVQLTRARKLLKSQLEEMYAYGTTRN